ncbi:MAG: tRNA (N(6)-L-threonylcarbamoyladenosine(37)-C(2))-methylthiotransferase MtaB [Candidatus Aadella gelida]|nr:tRNA (N(6)-L-threonylcarbamoyladenosine(37)-C(2))-methylthiotransferase MtaB [Candidatus Aadella gelida]
MKKFAIKTLGCKVNQYEEQVIREKLVKAGFVETEARSSDILIMNSCTVTAQADAKTRHFLRKTKKDNPNIKIAVTGCYAVLKEDIEKLTAMPEVDIVVPGGDKDKIPEILFGIKDGKDDSGCSGTGVEAFCGHTRTFLKIQDGCDQKCSYCKINIVRGLSKSRDEEDILNEVRKLAVNSKEIVLTGICLGAWKGKRSGSLAGLLREIEALEGDFRVRLSSIEPNFVDEEIINVIKNSKRICRHLHLPLQSGSGRILELMNRKYDCNEFEQIVKNVRDNIPLCGRSTDIITGFPGETEKEFSETVRFLKKIRPSRMHVFTYSDRKGTSAFDLTDKIPQDIAKKRTAELIELGLKLNDELCLGFLGKNLEILVEEIKDDGFCEGYSGEYLRVKFSKENSNIKIGDIVTVKAESIDRDLPGLIGQVA